MMELTAPREGPASGTVIEAVQDRGLGALATIMVSRGTLRLNDPLLVGLTWGRVRALMDSRGTSLTSVGPGQHAQVRMWGESR